MSFYTSLLTRLFSKQIMASIHFLLFFFFHLSLADQASYKNISTGTTLTPLTKPTSWLSPSGDFAFGFLPHPANTSLSLLAVWFDKMDNKTVVWCANGDAPVVAAESYNLTLSPDGRFSLTDPSGREIWNPVGVNKISHAAILDTGNLVLLSADREVLWQSFDHPTDTILPGQTLKQGTQVFARLMDADYTRGRFVLVLQDDGNLSMYPVAFPTPFHYPGTGYWATDIYGAGIFQVVYNQSGSIGVYYNNTFHTVISTEVPGDQYHRATLDPDGIFRQYAFPKNEPSTGSWMVKQTLASDICTKLLTGIGSGACGFNSYCTMDQDERVDCICAPHYSFFDNDRKYQGCKPNFAAQSCEPGGESSFDFQVVDNVDWPLADAELYSPMNETECRINCLNDCFCAVAMYNNGSCWKKKYPLSNGKLKIDVNRRALIKYSTSLSSSAQPEEERKLRDWRIWAIGGASLLLLVSVILNLGLLAARLSMRRKRTLVGASSDTGGPALCLFTYKELDEATKGFSEELGRGAFGTVYKGALVSDTEVLIAVKKLESKLELEAAEKDFMNEIHTIGLTHHKNLVRLLGFCKEGTHRLLVYEFISNGSLNKFLFGSDSPNWNQRIEIALGIARGLAYLHEECRTQIIHCDIKPQNILVDDNLVAKISDFGMAKLLRLEQTRTSTGIRGTIGYFAPEWFKNSAITAKVDVYSFGVLLLEIICCRKNLDWDYDFGSEVKPTLIDCTKECYRTGRLNLLVEEDEEAKKDGMRLERFAMVGISCVQVEPWMRPSMKKVVQMLEGTIEVAVPPNMYSLHM